MPFAPRRASAVAVYLINAAGGAFISSLSFTPLAVNYVTTAASIHSSWCWLTRARLLKQ